MPRPPTQQRPFPRASATRPALWIFCLLAATSACTDRDLPAWTAQERTEILRLSPLPPKPPSPGNRWADDPAAAALGHRLFFEPSLSGSGAFSCAHCHQPARAFADPRLVSRAAGETTRHAPSLLNLAWQRWFYWDGRADSLWAQALQPIEAPQEMAGDRTALARRLLTDREWRAALEPFLDITEPEAWAAGLPPAARPNAEAGSPAREAWAALDESDRQRIDHVFATVGKLLEAYQRRLVRDDAPFDTFVAALRGGDEAEARRRIPAAAQRGLRLFVGEARCIMCHHGPTLSDLEFHNLGLGPRHWLPARDPGRAAGIDALRADPFSGLGIHADVPATHPANDKLHYLARHEELPGQFKTPSLRNVALRPRFMHGAHFSSLADVIRFYNLLNEYPEGPGHREEILLPLRLDRQQQRDLLAFLETLTGEIREPRWFGPPATAP